MTQQMEQIENDDASMGLSVSDEGTDTSNPSSFHTEAPQNKPQKFKMAESETNRIRILRPLLIISTLLIGSVVTTITFLWLENDNAERSKNAVRNRSQNPFHCANFFNGKSHEEVLSFS
jgi:hypothetical protein